ncbi:putative holin-like toxin, partial [Staphylococcus aureus]
MFSFGMFIVTLLGLV